jgi:hypothetical protein
VSIHCPSILFFIKFKIIWIDGDGLQIFKNILLFLASLKKIRTNLMVYFWRFPNRRRPTIIFWDLWAKYNGWTVTATVWKSKKKNLGYTIRFVLIFSRDAKNRKNIFGDLQTVAVHSFSFGLYGQFWGLIIG